MFLALSKKYFQLRENVKNDNINISSFRTTNNSQFTTTRNNFAAVFRIIMNKRNLIYGLQYVSTIQMCTCVWHHKKANTGVQCKAHTLNYIQIPDFVLETV